MFQRLKGALDSAIDSRIAEEQAKQRNSQSSPSRSNSSTKQPTSRAASPAVRAARNRQLQSTSAEVPPRGPDPKEFEPEFVIDDEDTPSRSSTPKPAQTQKEEVRTVESGGEKALAQDGGLQAEDEKSAGTAAPTVSQELPTDVRVKLRKLEKLESRYQELLRSYRIAHARVGAVELFENTLREHTPLTSISDPGALVEYLNQLNLKGDMVLDELKRVSAERTTFKLKVDEAEKKTREAWDEVAKLREEKETNTGLNDNQISPQATKQPDATAEATAASPNIKEPIQPVIKSSAVLVKPRTPSIPGISLFSPRSKPVEVPKAAETEEFFSYDSELPRLEAELQDRQDKTNKLNNEMIGLKENLAVARESTQSMVQTLENATRDLNALREQKDHLELELSEQRQASQKNIDRLRSELEVAEGKVRQSENPATLEISQEKAELERLLSEAKLELEQMNGLVAEKDQAVANSAQLQRDLDKLTAEVSRKNLECDNDVKRIRTLNALVESLREQLDQTEQDKLRLQSDLDKGEASIKSVKQYLAEQEKIVIEHQKTANGVSTEIKPIQDAPASKKKNKKKKKGAKAVVEQEQEVANDVPRSATMSSPATTLVEADVVPDTDGSENLTSLQGELNNLRSLIEEKDAAINRLHSKLKHEEEMQEEIDSLRDDLIHVGQEHVESKDRLKALLAEKILLEGRTSDLEKELLDLRAFQKQNDDESQQAQKTLAVQFDELKQKAAGLQTDLSVAQQLASSRFKDLTDLRSVLQKAQPELTALRTETGELKATKEELSRRVIELQKVEVRHNILRTEIDELRKATSNKDTEISSLTQRLDRESKARLNAEEASSKASYELQQSEDLRRSLTQSFERASKDLDKSREEISKLKTRIREVEDSLFKAERESEGLREDVELKAAQHASAESLMSSMRDQTAEMAMQTKEARERCENLEEELADAHRLLNERTREGETMRRLLAEVEGRAETRVREMKERMDVALEERDKAEDEASTAGRRRVRESEELRNRLRDVERSLKRAEEDKEELEMAQREWKKRREELEHKSVQSIQEVENIKKAMSELRDALDESESQARELEKQKAELRHSVEDTQLRLDRLQKSNKTMTDELRVMQSTKTKALDSQLQSPRSSIDSTLSRAKVSSPGPSSRTTSTFHDAGPNGQSKPLVDYVYLKNILLQFLEQRDKKLQMQLIPVLGMLLHFDRKDEQKWMAAITTK